MEINRVLVSINDSKVDAEAIELACKVAKGYKGKVYIIYVIEVKRTLPVDARVTSEIDRAEEVLARAEGVAREQGHSVEAELLQSREVGPALVDIAVERDIDLVVMGLSYKKRFGEFSLGTTVPYVLKNAPCPVLLFQESGTQEVAGG